MRIEAYNQVQQVYSPKRTAKPQAASNAYQVRDNVEISSIGKDILTAKNAVKASPDVRTELVEPIKQKIANGTYDVDPGAFADKLLEKWSTAGA